MTRSTSPRAHLLGLFGFGSAVCAVVAMSIAAYSQHLPSALGVRHFDKCLHFFMAGTLAFFLDHALRGKALWRGPYALPRAALVLVPIGLEEFLQRLSPARTSDIWDFAADACGVATGIWFARFLKD